MLPSKKILILLMSCIGMAYADEIEIRRTTDGIPHIKASNWQDLGQGYGYVQAQDALCTLSEAFLTFEGQRSLHFGAKQRPEHDSTFGKPTNLELDIFFKAFATPEMIAAYRAEQPADLQAMISGFAVGFNRYLAEARVAGKEPCLKQAWVRNISADDIYRRMYAANIGAGYAKFIPQIVNAQPPQRAKKLAATPSKLAQQLAQTIGSRPGIGSNAVALGGEVTGSKETVLFGNPHWYWSGPDRFYQAHLTIPGKMNVAGVSFLGIPVIMIGFNEQVAWSHTVSEARRFGLFDLKLATPTQYQVDGVSNNMQSQTVKVPLRGGKVASRTLYRSELGPLVDLGAESPLLAWSQQKALAVKDINAENFRIFRTFFYWNQAQSLDEFVAIQKREAAVPWVNTIAIGRNDDRVWYGDIGAMPNAPDDLRLRCTTPVAQAFATLDAKTPVLDGSRSACQWQNDASAVQAGAMPAAQQPGLFRRDYVANMNDSYWLSNRLQPLEGFPALMGGEREVVSWRSQLGHQIAESLLQQAPLPASQVQLALQQQVLDARVWSAEQFKAPVLASVCQTKSVKVQADPLDGKKIARTASLKQACQVLSDWRNTGNADDRGAHLWEQFWARIESLPAQEIYARPFDYQQPLVTPNALRVADPRIAQSLGAAVLAVQASGLALDAPRRAYLYAGQGKSRVPLFGGCHEAGYFTVACGELGAKGIDGDFFGNSYLQLVRFTAEGVAAHTLLAHGQQDHGLIGVDSNTALLRYAKKDWLTFPFSDDAIQADLKSQQHLAP